MFCFGFRLVEVGILSGCSILLKRMCADVRIGLPEPPSPPYTLCCRCEDWYKCEKGCLGFRIVEVGILSGYPWRLGPIIKKDRYKMASKFKMLVGLSTSGNMYFVREEYKRCR